jgi:phospholipid-binding lipoprotein MlaA
MRKIICISLFAFLLQISSAIAGTTGSEEMKKSSNSNTAGECFEGLSRGIFKFNHALDRAIFEPVAKGYRALPIPIRKGTSNVISNLRSLLTLSNNILQGDFREAGNTAGRFVINTTIGVLGIWDPAAAAFRLESKRKEDFGQTLGKWGTPSGCYFVLPILGPTTVRDATGLVGNLFVDPVYQITHNTEVDFKAGNQSYSEHNYYYYRGADGVDFRAKNIESFDSLEKNSIDLYASIKSLYIQNRNKQIANSETAVDTLDDSDWEEIDTN